MPHEKKVCTVIGIGPGNGSAIARRFAADGYTVALLSRSLESSAQLTKEIPGAKGFACDVGNAASVAQAFAEIRKELGAVHTVVFNAGSGVFAALDDVTAADFETSWRVNALGLFLVAKEVVPAMKQAASGNIVVIGATASRRGAKMTTAFAPAKAAQRSFCESLAKQLGPMGIHVALIIIDGVVDLPKTRERMKDKPADYFVKPTAVADLASYLAHQDKSAWTFEAEARPFAENW
ncbi:MAG: 3-oxoacyl-[acyl-carrier-protein] reductase FabG1 [Turneriella sp.]|nr:3-oxoacyl-[acyl-carrier-protein] reductase FabG1 [Turneriella sp.]